MVTSRSEALTPVAMRIPNVKYLPLCVWSEQVPMRISLTFDTAIHNPDHIISKKTFNIRYWPLALELYSINLGKRFSSTTSVYLLKSPLGTHLFISIPAQPRPLSRAGSLPTKRVYERRVWPSPDNRTCLTGP